MCQHFMLRLLSIRKKKKNQSILFSEVDLLSEAKPPALPKASELLLAAVRNYLRGERRGEDADVSVPENGRESRRQDSSDDERRHSNSRRAERRANVERRRHDSSSPDRKSRSHRDKDAHSPSHDRKYTDNDGFPRKQRESSRLDDSDIERRHSNSHRDGRRSYNERKRHYSSSPDRKLRSHSDKGARSPSNHRQHDDSTLQNNGLQREHHRKQRTGDSGGEENRRDRSRDNEDDKERSRSYRSRNNEEERGHSRSSKRRHGDDNKIKQKRWAVEGDEEEEETRRSYSRTSTREEEVHAAGKENKPSISNIPAANASAQQPQGRSGGVYIPPFKLAQMMKEIQDKSSVEYQRMTWDALRKSINGLVNKVNASNIKNIIPELLGENLIRGRGLFARSCMKSQMASPLFTHVFSALVAVVNTKFPELGELLLKRIILQFRRALKRNDKPVLLAAARFIAHLVNQQVAHEVVALEVLMVLLENPTDDSVEVSVGFVKECGAILQDLAPQGLHGIFERFRGILHEGEIDKRVQFMIEGLFAIRKSGFQGHPAVLPELDLVDQEDQFTHEISLSEDLDAEMSLDIFKADPNFLESEKKYEDIKKDILGESSSDDDDDGDNGSGQSSDDDEDDEDEEEEMQRMKIRDETETNLVNLRRTIYLTIMSSVDFEEAGHKLLKIKLEPGQEMELNIMLLECCSQERTYLRYYGLLGQRFCMINSIYQKNFDMCFMKQYSMIHRLETNKLRNVAKFFAHLLGTDALPWTVLVYIKLTEEDTTSSSRIFIKILCQELSEHLGLRKLNEKLNDPEMQDSFKGIFPKDNPKDTSNRDKWIVIQTAPIPKTYLRVRAVAQRVILEAAALALDQSQSRSRSQSRSPDESEGGSILRAYCIRECFDSCYLRATDCIVESDLHSYVYKEGHIHLPAFSTYKQSIQRLPSHLSAALLADLLMCNALFIVYVADMFWCDYKWEELVLWVFPHSHELVGVSSSVLS
ncbi:hypothetical protein GOP47_0019558 [Adiantum capillus-veneris]|uniref:MI domain-containing protein n=1 Tax=Adiantum capillus-veneris TaxID=13818 RepID=A0A9D4UC89_ADICA|nr:hypothetical protein GOP47_0019558 [Adiantum capillus-veneris]